jgi:hypothetical protein
MLRPLDRPWIYHAGSMFPPIQIVRPR